MRPYGHVLHVWAVRVQGKVLGGRGWWEECSCWVGGDYGDGGRSQTWKTRPCGCVLCVWDKESRMKGEGMGVSNIRNVPQWARFWYLAAEENQEHQKCVQEDGFLLSGWTTEVGEPDFQALLSCRSCWGLDSSFLSNDFLLLALLFLWSFSLLKSLRKTS